MHVRTERVPTRRWPLHLPQLQLDPCAQHATLAANATHAATTTSAHARAVARAATCVAARASSRGWGDRDLVGVTVTALDA